MFWVLHDKMRLLRKTDVPVLFVFANAFVMGVLPAAEFEKQHAALKKANYRNKKNEGTFFTYDAAICARPQFEELVRDLICTKLESLFEIRFSALPVRELKSTGEYSFPFPNKTCFSPATKCVFHEKKNLYVYVVTAFTKEQVEKLFTTLFSPAVLKGFSERPLFTQLQNIQFDCKDASFYNERTLVVCFFREIMVFSWVRTPAFTDFDVHFKKWSSEGVENVTNSRTLGWYAIRRNRTGNGIVNRIIQNMLCSVGSVTFKHVLVDSCISSNMRLANQPVAPIDATTLFSVSLAENRVVFYDFSRFPNADVAEIFSVAPRFTHPAGFLI